MVNQHFRHTHRFVWLVIAIVIFGAAAGYVGVVAPDSVSNILDSSKDKITDLMGPGELNTRVNISAELKLRDFDVSYPAKILSVDFVSPDANVKINSENLDLSELSSGTLALFDWSGNLKVISEGGISLEGEASRLTANSVAILPEKENLAVKTEKLQFSLARLDSLSIKKFSYASSGKVSINDGQITANLNEETLGLKDFEGYIEITPGNLVLNGTVSNIEVAGKTLSTTIK